MQHSTSSLVLRFVSIFAADVLFTVVSANPVESERSRTESVALFALFNLVVNCLQGYEREHRFSPLNNRTVRVLTTATLSLPSAVVAGSSWNYFSNTGNAIALGPSAIAAMLMLFRWVAYASWSPERNENPV